MFFIIINTCKLKLLFLVNGSTVDLSVKYDIHFVDMSNFVWFEGFDSFKFKIPYYVQLTKKKRGL